MEFKAKPTLYKNVLFKSRLEAEYAKLFDRHNIEWQYESSTFDFGEMGYGTGRHKSYYTPDFYSPKAKIYFECKGVIIFGTNFKEGWFVTKTGEKLHFGAAFYPNAYPDSIAVLESVYVKHDGYSAYTNHCNSRKIRWEEFIALIK